MRRPRSVPISPAVATALAIACLLAAVAGDVGAQTLDETSEHPAVAPAGGPWQGGPTVDVPRTLTYEGLPALEAGAVGEDGLELDGRLDEAAWRTAQVAADFVQYEPDEGRAASQPTEARVLYGTDALWVGLRAWDSAPDSIAAQLTRRDQQVYSDWLGVMVDSYRDRRTAFHFMVNPLGVKIDIYRFDDTAEDVGWDAVWDVATSRDDEGWTAEFRIPYSQLRFRDEEEQVWGIQFVREIARYAETSAWAPTLRSESAIVSRFGELRGISGLASTRRLEVTPYTLARLRRAPGDPADPFHDPTEASGTAGADVKYGLTGDLTLDLTINPDFGQVEADPAQVNLS
ncbi:MAG TPA: DUF5916 domain-containing protein, partial [Longimicrobiales bacterium]|nr:DUF5916 domain-containing protein [Longimicrobiales bacterium]